MAYEPTNWKSGDVVTSAKLNKLEQGVASSGYDIILKGENDAEENLVYSLVDASYNTVVAKLNDGIMPSVLLYAVVEGEGLASYNTISEVISMTFLPAETIEGEGEFVSVSIGEDMYAFKSDGTFTPLIP